MRTTLAMALVILLGIALGIGVARLRTELAPWNPELDKSSETPTPALQPSGPTPKVVVKQTDYEFGAIDITASGSHEFVFANAGDAPLALTSGGTSCRCTMSKLDQEKIPPGGSAKVTIAWKPTDKLGPYRQTAKILTNDPAQPQVTLTVSGRITVAMQFSPPELVFSRLSAGETAIGQSRLLYYLDEPLKILGHTWSNAATAQYFDVDLQPLSEEELKAEPSARSGMLVKVTVKPGLPPGPIRQTISLQTNSAALPVAALPIQGAIGSEIAVVGRGWDPDAGVLTLGKVSSRVGVERGLMLVVRGRLRKEVAFKPMRVEPNALQVRLGRPSEMNNGAVVQIPLIIGVARGSPPANHLGSEQGQLGEIILETTHPQVPKLQILVRFAIEG